MSLAGFLPGKPRDAGFYATPERLAPTLGRIDEKAAKAPTERRTPAARRRG